MPEPITPKPVEIAVTAEVPVLEAEKVVQSTSDNSNSDMDAVLDRLLGIDEPESTREFDTPETSAPDADFDRALKALQRDGVPSEVIDSMKSNPSKMKEWGLKAAKRQSDVDAFGAKVADSKKTDTNSSESPKSSLNTEDGEADADPLSQFSEIFGEDAAKPLKSMQDRLRKEFAEQTRMIEVKHESQLAYQQIAAEYGAKAPNYTTIAEAAAKIGRENPSKFDSVEAIVRAAFQQQVGMPSKPDPRNTARPTVGHAPPRVTKTVDVQDRVLDILLSGGNRDDVRKALSR
jgi:hypothetical protein